MQRRGEPETATTMSLTTSEAWGFRRPARGRRSRSRRRWRSGQRRRARRPGCPRHRRPGALTGRRAWPARSQRREHHIAVANPPPPVRGSRPPASPGPVFGRYRRADRGDAGPDDGVSWSPGCPVSVGQLRPAELVGLGSWRTSGGSCSRTRLRPRACPGRSGCCWPPGSHQADASHRSLRRRGALDAGRQHLRLRAGSRRDRLGAGMRDK